MTKQKSKENVDQVKNGWAIIQSHACRERIETRALKKLLQTKLSMIS